MPKTIQEIASEYLEHFTQAERTNGQKFWKTGDDRPEELTNLIHEAHGDMLPDDYRYEFIYDALVAISESDEPDEPEIEADIYTADLMNWLSSRADRYSYVDEYVEEVGVDTKNFQLTNLIGCGQIREKEEVYYSVLNSLREIEEAQEDEDEDEE